MQAKAIGYPVTAKKFWLLSISTLGLWTFYWLFINFQALRRRPYAFVHWQAECYSGALFLSYYDLISLVELEARNRSVPLKMPPKGLCFVVFMVAFPAVLMDMMGFETIVQPILKLIVLWLLEPVRKAINRINELSVPAYKITSSFGPFEKIIFAIGVCYWLACAYLGFF